MTTKMGKEERLKKVKIYYNSEEGFTQFEIAEKVGVTLMTVYKDIKYLINIGELTKRPKLKRKAKKLTKEQTEQRRQNVKKLCEQGLKITEIKDKLEIRSNTVCDDIKYLRNKGLLNEQLVYRAYIKRLCNRFFEDEEDNNAKTLDEFKRYMLDCKIRFRENKIDKEELPIVKEVATLTDKYTDIVFYLRLCVKFGKISEAMKFVNSHINNESFTKEQTDEIRDLRERIVKMDKKCIAIETLKGGRGVEQAMTDSGLSEVEVLELNRNLIQENSSKEELEDEEPRLA